MDYQALLFRLWRRSPKRKLKNALDCYDSGFYLVILVFWLRPAFFTAKIRSALMLRMALKNLFAWHRKHLAYQRIESSERLFAFHQVLIGEFVHTAMMSRFSA